MDQLYPILSFHSGFSKNTLYYLKASSLITNKFNFQDYAQCSPEKPYENT